LKGEERGGVNWESLKVVFLNLIGIKTPEREKQAPKEEIDETQ
jgi:hypothetical protein